LSYITFAKQADKLTDTTQNSILLAWPLPMALGIGLIAWDILCHVRDRTLIKLTPPPARMAGEGITFSSRVVLRPFVSPFFGYQTCEQDN